MDLCRRSAGVQVVFLRPRFSAPRPSHRRSTRGRCRAMRSGEGRQVASLRSPVDKGSIQRPGIDSGACTIITMQSARAASVSRSVAARRRYGRWRWPAAAPSYDFLAHSRSDCWSHDQHCMRQLHCVRALPAAHHLDSGTSLGGGREGGKGDGSGGAGERPAGCMR